MDRNKVMTKKIILIILITIAGAGLAWNYIIKNNGDLNVVNGEVKLLKGNSIILQTAIVTTNSDGTLSFEPIEQKVAVSDRTVIRKQIIENGQTYAVDAGLPDIKIGKQIMVYSKQKLNPKTTVLKAAKIQILN